MGATEGAVRLESTHNPGAGAALVGGSFMVEMSSGSVLVRLRPIGVIEYSAWYELALMAARRVLARRGWSLQDREDAAADAIAENYELFGDPECSTKDIEDAFAVTIGQFRKVEGAARRVHNHFAPDKFDVSVGKYHQQAAIDENLAALHRRQEAGRLCRALLSDPATLKAVKPVVLLAAVIQIEPILVDEQLVRVALEASRGGQGILRSPASFRQLLPPLLNGLALAMESKPRCKQFPDEIRKLAWLFRGKDGERFEDVSPARLATYVAWFYKQRSRGEQRLAQVPGV